MNHYGLQALAKPSVLTFFPVQALDCSDILQLCNAAVDQKSQINLLI